MRNHIFFFFALQWQLFADFTAEMATPKKRNYYNFMLKNWKTVFNGDLPEYDRCWTECELHLLQSATLSTNWALKGNSTPPGLVKARAVRVFWFKHFPPSLVLKVMDIFPNREKPFFYIPYLWFFSQLIYKFWATGWFWWSISWRTYQKLNDWF